MILTDNLFGEIVFNQALNFFCKRYLSYVSCKLSLHYRLVVQVEAPQRISHNQCLNHGTRVIDRSFTFSMPGSFSVFFPPILLLYSRGWHFEFFLLQLEDILGILGSYNQTIKQGWQQIMCHCFIPNLINLISEDYDCDESLLRGSRFGTPVRPKQEKAGDCDTDLVEYDIGEISSSSLRGWFIFLTKNFTANPMVIFPKPRIHIWTPLSGCVDSHDCLKYENFQF